MTPSRPPSRQWRWPIALGLLTLVGLLAALLGEGGIWWALSWAALATPLIVIARQGLWPGTRKGGHRARRHAC